MSSVDFGRYKRIVQYFWDTEPKNDDVSMSPIWCLGTKYPSGVDRRRKSTDLANSKLDLTVATSSNGARQNSNSPVPSQARNGYSDREGLATSRKSPKRASSPEEEGRGWPPEFLDDFESRMWFTYRSSFAPIQKSLDPSANSSMSLKVRLRSQLVDQGGFTSDTGWGCMIRSGQCLLANALSLLRLGREWRCGTQGIREAQVLSLFADDPEAPFSIHRFVSHGATACGKHPGEWFGPSATASCIEALSQEYVGTGLKVYLSRDGADVYEDSFLRLAKSGNGGFHPVLILVGIRLGIDRVTPVYWNALKASLQLAQSVGIAGGRPSSSHYFVGVQGDNIFYHDPHQVRPALPLHGNLDDYTTDEISSCHTRRLRRLHIKDMDPSMLIAFLIKDESDWRKWREAMSQTQGKAVVHVADTEPQPHGEGTERESAVDEVETFDDDDDNEDELNGVSEDGELVECPEA